MKKKFLEMFTLQDKLNTNTNGKNWKSGITNKGKEINWNRCIYMEAAEAIDSFPTWKHWKNIDAKPNWDNLKIEIVDIWHFIMSEMIVKYGIEESVERCYYFYDTTNFKQLAKKFSMFDILEDIMLDSLLKRVPYEMFFVAVRKIKNFNMDDIYSLYIGKNCLNQFRQEHGYKEGTYIKEWNGKEDNVYMQNLMKDNPSMNYDELYASLEEIYRNTVEQF